MNADILLTILVPTVPSRLVYFYPKIMAQLLSQTEKYNNIEVISFFDNKKRTIGKKRNEMLNLAQGKYVTFVDDDDRLTDDYIDEIMNALNNNNNVDCVVYNVICCVNDGNIKKLCKYGIEFQYGDINGGLEWRGKPAHTMVWKSSIAKKHVYSNMQHGEDIEWVLRAYLDIKTQYRIDKVLYYYDANYATTSETSNLPDSVIYENVNKLKMKSITEKVDSTINQVGSVDYINDNFMNRTDISYNITISYVCLIYKSTKWLRFVYEQFHKHTKLNYGDEFYFVANDACPEVLEYLKKHPEIKYYIHENTEEQKKEWYINNVYRAWNTAAKKANGDYIVFLNSDFAFSPNWEKNLTKHININRCVCSRLVERGILRSGTYGIEKNFGNNHSDYNEESFLNYSNQIKENKLEKGGLFMPLLVKKQHLELVGYYPEGNIRMDSKDIFKPTIAKKGEKLIPGDAVLMEKLRRINVHHYTSFDSIVYHFQEGEMRE